MPKSATLNQPAVSLVTVTLTQDKETKGAYRYSDSNEHSVLPTLYVRKEAFAALTDIPTQIEVTVKAVVA